MKMSDIDQVKQSLVDVHPKNLIRLIYISDVCTTDDTVFGHIQRHSTTYNRDHNITGFLCNDAKSFLQYLEGNKYAVLDLMSRTFVNSNHTNVRVILAEPISGHIFSDWRMHSLNLNNSSWGHESDYPHIKNFIPFEPKTWQPWFVQSFIDAMKQFDNFDFGHHSNSIIFDTIGVRQLELRLSQDSLLFWLFLGCLASTAFVMVLFSYEII